jgi:pyruvate dehydrogenase (quinone)
MIPNPSELNKIASLLQKNQRTASFCGQGCAVVHQELMQLCDTLKAPMVHAIRGKEHVEYDNPYDVGMTGFIGFSSRYYAMED